MGLGDDPDVVELKNARIYRDAYNIPHVYADDLDSLWYANGYVQAMDRLFTMDVLRHVGKGDSASYLGPSQFSSDVGVRRTLYTAEQRQEMADAAPADSRAALESYVDGVNRAIAEMTATNSLPAEFGALQHAPEPWTLDDSIAVIAYLLDYFGQGGGSELSNARLLTQLESTLGAGAAEAAFSDHVWGRNDDAYSTIKTGEYVAPVQTPKAFDDIPADQKALIEPASRAQTFGIPDEVVDAVSAEAEAPFGIDVSTLKFGSNALILSGELSESGEAMVGGGPQMGYFNPQVPYELGLHGPGLDASGIGVLGAPAVIIGRTPTFAWTVTSGISDQNDVVALPAAGDRSYLWDGEERALDCRTEHIVVGGGPAATTEPPQVYEQEVCTAGPHPVVAVTYEPGTNDPEYFWAIRKVHRGLELQGATQWLNVQLSTDLEEFRANFDGFPFTFNFNYAGPEGACYHHVGKQPIRNPTLDPRFPTPAGSAYHWIGNITGDAMPRTCSDTDYFANWNNLPQTGWPTGDSRELWGSLHRVERLDHELNEVLAEDDNGKLTMAQLQDVLERAATEDSLATQIIPSILANDPGTAPAAIAALEAWNDVDTPWRVDGKVSNYGEHYDDAGHTVYDELLVALLDEVFRDELGGLVRTVDWEPSFSNDPHAGDHGKHGNKFAVLVDALDGATTVDWCDDITTTTVETCADQVADALAATGLESYATVADIPLTEQHYSPFTALGAGPAYKMPMTNRATYYHFHDTGADVDSSESAMAPGQVGRLSPLELALITANPEGKDTNDRGPEHMRDQLPLYVDFEFKPVYMTEAALQGDGFEPTELVVVR